MSVETSAASSFAGNFSAGLQEGENSHLLIHILMFGFSK